MDGEQGTTKYAKSAKGEREGYSPQTDAEKNYPTGFTGLCRISFSRYPERNRRRRLSVFHVPASQRHMKRTISLRSLRLCGEKMFILVGTF
jgi:hypothetical protein